MAQQVEAALKLFANRLQGAHRERLQGLLGDNHVKVVEEVKKDMEKTLQSHKGKALEHAKGVSRRFFFCCDYQPKHVTLNEFVSALAMDIPTYVFWMTGQPEAKYKEMRILIAAAEIVNTHAATVLSKESKKHKESSWLAFPAFNYLLEQKWKGIPCVTCGKIGDEVKACPTCNCGSCKTCPPHIPRVCAVTAAELKYFVDKYYPKLLEPSDLQICVKCHDFLTPVLYCPCKQVTYCSKECQKADRKEHKPVCTYVKPADKKKQE